MERNAKKLGLSALAAVLLLGSCLKPEEFPEEPAIDLKSFAVDNDTLSQLNLEISFTDGDGDIGLADGDTFPPFDTSSYYYENLKIRFERFENGSWVDVDSEWQYRLPVITPSGQNKALKGEIFVRIGPYPGPRSILQPEINAGDTVRANVLLIDRALHISNTVTTAGVKLLD